MLTLGGEGLALCGLRLITTVEGKLELVFCCRSSRGFAAVAEDWLSTAVSDPEACSLRFRLVAVRDSGASGAVCIESDWDELDPHEVALRCEEDVEFLERLRAMSVEGFFE